MDGLRDDLGLVAVLVVLVSLVVARVMLPHYGGSVMAWSTPRFIVVAAVYSIFFVVVAVISAVRGITGGVVVGTLLAVLFAAVALRALQKGSPGDRLRGRGVLPPLE